MKTIQSAGKNLVASYVEDPMGRRLILASRDGEFKATKEVLQIGTTQSEVREVIRVLRELSQELPP